MGIQLSVSTIKMMKSIFFACLVAAAHAYRTYAAPAYTTGYANYGYAGLNAGHYIGKREAEAEPEADAEAFYGYNGPFNGYTGYALPAYRSYAAPAYRTYAAPAYTTGYANYGYAGLNAGHYIGKREAEAEPEADAYYGTYGYNGLSGLGYSGLGYGYASTYAAAPVARTYAAAPLVRSYAAAPIARSYGYGLTGSYGYGLSGLRAW